MAAENPIAEGNPRRKKRPYRKSTSGCRNCKLRRVKCDEIKPRCQRCKTYGVLCNYDSSVPDLEMPVEGQGVWQAHRPEPLAAHKTALLPTPLPSTDTVCIDMPTLYPPELDRVSMDLLYRFKHRTLPTLGNPAIVSLYEKELFRLAFYNPILMHATLTKAAAHERYLSGFPVGRRSLLEVYHWSQCVALFNQKLSQPIQDQDRDPLWAAAASFGLISFSSIDSSKPEEVWPLKSPEPSDLQWLQLCEGKLVVWDLVKPLRPDSIFCSMSMEYGQLFSPTPPLAGMDEIPPQLAHVCNIDESSTRENNPYFGAVHALIQLQRLPQDQLSAMKCLSFTRQMHQPFKNLLKEKDPVALLIMALWYGRLRSVAWWIEQRAAIERQSICLYLERQHQEAGDIMDILPWEKGEKAEFVPTE